MAQAYVRLSIQITPEVAEKLEELARVLGTTKKSVIEEAISEMHEKAFGSK